MSQKEDIVFIPKIDDTSFKKGIESMMSSASGMMNEIRSSLDAAGESSIKLSSMFADAVKQSDVLTSAFKAIEVGSEIFTFANNSIVPLLQSLSIGETAVGLLTGKIELATIAHAAWNAVKQIDPLVMVVTAVSALAAGLTFLSLNTNSAAKEHENLMTKINEEQQSYSDLKEKQNQQMDSNLTEIGNVQNLVGELKTLVDENGKIKEGYEERAAFIVNEMNQAYGTNAEIIDGEIQGYGDLSSSIDGIMEKKRAEIILEAELPAYKEAVLKSTEAQIEADKMKSDLTDMNMEKKQLEAELEAKYGEDWEDKATKRVDKQLWALEKLEEDTTRKQEEYDAQNATVMGYYDDINNYETNAALIASGNVENYKKVQADSMASKQETAQGKIAAIEDEKTADESYLTYLKEQYSAETDEFQRSQIEAKIKGKEESIKQKEGEIEGLKSTIINKGPEYDAEVRKMASDALDSFSGDTEKYFGVSQKKLDKMVSGLNSSNPEVRKSAQKTANDMLEDLNSKNDQYSKSGAEVIDGILNGSNSKVGNLYSTMENYGGTMLSKFRSSLCIQSPSKKFAELARFIPEGIKEGLKSGEDVALNEVDNIGDRMITIFKKFNFNDIFSAINKTIFSEQLKMASIIQTQSKIEMLKSSILKAETQSLYGKLDAVIENHVDLDGRELAVALAPMISEELAFNWR